MMLRVIDFLARHVAALDRADYDAWLEPFEPDCVYRILSSENLDLDYDFPLLLARNKDMLIDRIASLREANIYNIHRDRHVLGLPVVEQHGERVRAETSLAVYQTDQDGVSGLFCVGRYVDELRAGPAALTLRRRDVILDTFGIIRLLSTPL